MHDQAVIVEQELNAPVEKVWKAISDRDEMEKWYFNIAAFRPESGFEFEFSGGPPEKSYLHLCKVKEALPNKKLSYTWRYDGYEGESLVIFELFEVPAGCKLKLTHADLETFPKSEPAFARANFVAGWNEIIGRLLPGYLSKG